MLPWTPPPSWDPSSGAYVTTDLIFAGRQYLEGETFELDGVDDMQLRNMFLSGRIRFGKPPEAMAKALEMRRERAKSLAAEAEKAAKARAELASADVDDEEDADEVEAPAPTQAKTPARSPSARRARAGG